MNFTPLGYSLNLILCCFCFSLNLGPLSLHAPLFFLFRRIFVWWKTTVFGVNICIEQGYSDPLTT